MKKKVGTINVEPKWMEIYPTLREWILYGNETEKELVCIELKKLCETIDELKKGRENEKEQKRTNSPTRKKV